MEYEKPYKYGMSVKISNWHDRMLSYPLDNSNPQSRGASHYRTFVDSNLQSIPKTTTQEQLESGIISNCEFRQVAKAEINFVSYPMNDFRFDNYGPKEPQIIIPSSTTYREVFKAPKPLIEKKDCCEKVLDPLLNRIPKNDFEMLPSSTNKFMDDHLVKPHEGRKKINFLRQLRNSTHILP
ncbi:uncharacterized protein LOC129905602 [Episyrphus balteatus]|uniref:uncharacterized protein LOC129905602 n=1 Tax=Episyrphus balteatus TaxID=286459 RepID=UPI00248693EB|nr:uncharacterized protein LOC129905602 [Episyrphus balteatus]XP_055837103.1 uncharacterized protein LOC129905602 [Episyrphus balteatus]